MSAPKILIVDDEPFNVDYLEQELEDAAYTTITSMNGQDALVKVQVEAPDLVLLDIMMPVMDGFEVLSRLKADPATRHIPVIVISASNSLQSVVKGIQLGAEDYLPKPFEPTLLHARISSCLEKKRLRDLERQYLKGLERELDIARQIQQGFLPSELPEVAGWELATFFKAAHEVAGDYYDAFLLPDGNLVCVVGDVCGKGVGAALFMTLFRTLFRATLTTDTFRNLQDGQSLTPAQRLQHVVAFTNQYVIETHGDTGLFTTVVICILNLQDGALTYLNCGNEHPLIIGSTGITPLIPTGPVIGVIPDARFTVKKVSLGRNELFFVYTDGVTDALNIDENFFGKERLLKSLGGCDCSPAKLLADVETQLREFIGTANQFDDITMLALKKRNSG
jgi:sigma-B regulation protein RsbU (phosphoserine phosphatase)